MSCATCFSRLGSIQNGLPTVDGYLNRVPKARILEAVREAKGEGTAQLLDRMKKGEMAMEVERLLKGSGWLPEVVLHGTRLRTRARTVA
jgi:hypothetical protein